jgi:valyl-tRNA synthetase
MEGIIDTEAETARLDKEIGKLKSNLIRLEKKLGNAAFVDKAPAAVVAKEQDKMLAQKQALEILEKQRQRIQEI